MRAPTTVKLVRGFHEQTPIPKSVKQYDWPYRAAVVIDSYVPDVPEMVFDSALFTRFLESIDTALKATTRVIKVIDPKTAKPVALHSLAELTSFYQGCDEENRDLPEEVLWFDGAANVGGGFPERWYAVGGPEIYHDSFTFSVFSQKEIYSALSASAAEVCASTNARLIGIYEGKMQR